MVGVPHLTGKQKIYTAIVILVCEPGGVEQRLEAAYRSVVAAVDPQLDLPPELSSEFAQIRDELRKEFIFRQPSESHVDRPRWASTMAAKLVAFYDGLARYK
jgi:hypothetical protein